MGSGKRVSNSGAKGGNYGKYDKKSMIAMNKSQEAVKSASKEHQLLLAQPRRRSARTGTQAQAEADPTRTEAVPERAQADPTETEAAAERAQADPTETEAAAERARAQAAAERARARARARAQAAAE